MGQQSFIDTIGPLQMLFVLAVIGIPLLLRFGPALLGRLSQSAALPARKVPALELSAVPANRIMAATRAGPAAERQIRPVTTADQNAAFEAVMGTIRSIPTDRGMEHPVRQAIVFRQFFPPPHDGRGLSFFGGVPISPPSFAWPCVENASGSRRPLHFLMQIDCAEVPADARLGLLPERGVIYVFLDMEQWPSDVFRVLYEAEPGAHWNEAPTPDGLSPVYGPQAPYVWGWTQALEGGAARCPNTLPKWPFRPVAIPVPAPAVDESETEDAALWWPGDKAVAQALLEAQGEEVVARAFSDVVISKDGSLGRPFETYPHDWHAIEICAGLLLKRLRRPGGVSLRSLAALSAEERAALLERIAAEARRWIDRAAKYDSFAAVPDADRAAFWAWLEEHAAIVRFVLPEAATNSVEASLAHSGESAARIPRDATACVHARHALACRVKDGVHASTPDRMLAPPSDVQGNQYEIATTHLLLLELSSNEGLGHHFSEGVYQFWITPDDLEARRFDKVVLTADAY